MPETKNESIQEFPILVKSVHVQPGSPPTPMNVIVVGAGGTGGRLIPPLMQILKQGDSVAIVDGDIVEQRNLLRQNFRIRDIGENKAEVMARRYRRDGINVAAFATMYKSDLYREMINHGYYKTIFLGCVDNPEARNEISNSAPEESSIWIDGGNEMRGGQVIVSANGWPFEVSEWIRDRNEYYKRSSLWHIRGMKAMPQLLTISEKPQEGCGNRIDLQTVAVNQLSATCMLNALTCILHGVTFSNCGVFFSTLNTMSPIKLAKVDWDYNVVNPELTYASK